MQDRIKTGLWVRFTADGIPAWFGPAWVDGAEFVEGVPAETLITHRRVDGKWLPREPVPQLPAPEVPPEDSAPEPVDLKAEIAELAARLAELQAKIEG
jgi:hypothetical protein